MARTIRRARLCTLAGLAAALCVAACAGPRSAQPVLYPNAHYQHVGSVTAETDIASCEKAALGPDRSEGDAAWKAAVETCLRERGYEPAGWR